jgi:hypothetical protein
MAHPGKSQGVGFAGVLLGLDDKPTGIAGLAQRFQDGRKNDATIARPANFSALSQLMLG